MNGYGCIFENFGIIPEKACCCDGDDIGHIQKLKNECQNVKEEYNMEYNIANYRGNMTCVEYASLKGYHEILELLIENSQNRDILKQYFSLNDAVERAFLISKNKSSFFDKFTLMEINRYEAAIFTAIAFGQTECLKILLKFVSISDLHKHFFLRPDGGMELMSATEFAQLKNQPACYGILESKY